MQTIHERFMTEAMKMARIGLEKGELPIGAVIRVAGEKSFSTVRET